MFFDACVQQSLTAGTTSCHPCGGHEGTIDGPAKQSVPDSLLSGPLAALLRRGDGSTRCLRATASASARRCRHVLSELDFGGRRRLLGVGHVASAQLAADGELLVRVELVKWLPVRLLGCQWGWSASTMISQARQRQPDAYGVHRMQLLNSFAARPVPRHACLRPGGGRDHYYY